MSQTPPENSLITLLVARLRPILIVLLASLASAYVISHFPFGRVEYVYQQY